MLLFLLKFPLTSLDRNFSHWYSYHTNRKSFVAIRLRLKCDGTHAETRFRLSAKRTSPSKSAGVSVQLTTGSRGVRISGSNSGYTSVKSTGYQLHSPVSPSLLLPCVTVCHHVSVGLYHLSVPSRHGRAPSPVQVNLRLRLIKVSQVRVGSAET